MASYLSSAPVAICDRCSFKFPWKDLVQDGNSRGLRVCISCADPPNPWTYCPPIKPDRISLKWSRPDVPLNSGIPYLDDTNPINPIPPSYFFGFTEGLEGAGSVSLEGGGGEVGFELDTFRRSGGRRRCGT